MYSGSELLKIVTTFLMETKRVSDSVSCRKQFMQELFTDSFTFDNLLDGEVPSLTSIKRSIHNLFARYCTTEETLLLDLFLYNKLPSPSSVEDEVQPAPTPDAPMVVTTAEPDGSTAKKLYVPPRRTNRVSPSLNKHLRATVLDRMKSVQIKYPHYTCSGCSVCDLAFTTLDITSCSSRHGGPPCNDIALYPHASKTYLQVAHETGKCIGMQSGYRNPLKDKELSISPRTNIGVLNDGPRPSYNQVAYNYAAEENRATQRLELVKEIRRQENGRAWKLRPMSSHDEVQFALQQFKRWKKIPNFQIPSWASCSSKLLFQTLDWSIARQVGHSTALRQFHFRERRKYLRANAR